MGPTVDQSWVTVHHPIALGDSLPAERRMVLVWCHSSHIPYVGYIRYASGELRHPYFVVPQKRESPVDVIAWCDCLNHTPPEGYQNLGLAGRGFPARIHNLSDVEEQERKYQDLDQE